MADEESAYAKGVKSREHEKTVRAIDMKMLYELFSNLQRGMVNMYHGRGGTYRIAKIFGIEDPAQVEAFWAEVASVRSGLITPIRTLDYSVEELATPEEPEEPRGVADEGGPIDDEAMQAMPATIEELEARLGRPLTKREKKEFKQRQED